MALNNYQDADFTPDITPSDVRPNMGTYNSPQTFRFWCQKVLPLVYDNSLSYYELLCKVVDYLNKTMEDVNTAVEDVENLNSAFGSLENHVNASETALLQAYTDLQNYVNSYFNNLDVQQEINNKLDAMAEDGTLDALLLPYFNTYTEATNAIIDERFETQDGVLNNQNNRINVLESRMDGFSSLPDGSLSTAADAELVDIRVGYNSETYTSAGTAVRTQVSSLNSAISEDLKAQYKTPYESLNTMSLTTGGVSPTGGTNLSFTTYPQTCKYGYVNFDKDIIFICTTPNFKYNVWAYTAQTVSNKVRSLTGDTYVPSGTPVVIPFADNIKYFRVGFSKIDGTSVDSTTDFALIEAGTSLYSWGEVDATLTKEGIAGEAKATGDRLTALEYPYRYDLLNILGVSTGGIDPTTGVNLSYNSNLSTCKMGYGKTDKKIAIICNNPDYEYNVWVYSSMSTSTAIESLTDNSYVPSGTYVIVPFEEYNLDYVYVRIGFKRIDGATVTDSDLPAVKNSIKLTQKEAYSEELLLPTNKYNFLKRIIGIGGISSLTVIGGYLYVFAYTAHNESTTGKLFEIQNDGSLKLSDETFTSNIGHQNTVDYCTGNKCLIASRYPMASGETDFNLFIIPNVDETTRAFDVTDSNTVSIDLSGESEIGHSELNKMTLGNMIWHMYLQGMMR